MFTPRLARKNSPALRALRVLPLLCLCGLPVPALARPPAVAADYDRASDLFNLLDNLPDWLPGYTAAAYRQDWGERYGMTADDEGLLAAYRAFRLRHAPAARTDAGDPAIAVLAAPATRLLDPFARFFFEGDDFRAGLRAAIAAQPAAERPMLRAYFGRFAPRARMLLAGRSRFGAQQATLRAGLADPRVAGFIREMRAFYGGPPAPRFIARFAWWPVRDMSQAKVRGRYILLQSDPAGPMATDWAPIVFHEYAHHLSAGMPDRKRRRLAAAFLRLCPAAARLPNPLNALEEPLAIYWGQYRFTQSVRRHALDPSEPWYVRPLPDRIGKALARAFPATAPAPRLDARLIEVAGAECARAVPEAG